MPIHQISIPLSVVPCSQVSGSLLSTASSPTQLL
ncbi:hypothetical protein FOXG_19170 [Fusarium oxysporum f. sp. lycopersici 4287]|uniref:Uncharacterized protein n=1 Tax=Fusarium oxysporum f. sp. lycopersici (strain 4287 / CBS 123668 / FGSC 9935 / NRRL 34936) TaxID=426428 RepID=A0A0J9UW10_FUSO4|nr:hypothetical protein FOXG_19170 [Fusarium oxysporum f. sp. lycopersici 4287]KAI8413652.1 hypothetical protein FOFC_06933 [Fusarium oxysporum]KNB03624.1 hypothetical protein FOXG_19170 [Fusarium oxysporum f. sp. lycopersici 4287]